MPLILNELIVDPSSEWAVGIDRNYSLFLTSPPTKVPTLSSPQRLGKTGLFLLECVSILTLNVCTPL